MGILEAGKARVLARIMGQATAPKVDTKPRLVDAAEMAATLGVPTFWVQDKARRGIIPSINIGHYRRFCVPEVIETVRHLPTASHDSGFCGAKKHTKKRGAKGQWGIPLTQVAPRECRRVRR